MRSAEADWIDMELVVGLGMSVLLWGLQKDSQSQRGFIPRFPPHISYPQGSHSALVLSCGCIVQGGPDSGERVQEFVWDWLPGPA